MSKPSFVKYVIQKINQEYTIVSKILLSIVVLSSFIPIPEGDTATATTIEKLIAVYDSVIVVLMIGLLLALGTWYVDYDMDKNRDDNNIFKLYVFLVITPIISISTYFFTNILTPLQIAICVPTIIMIVMHIIHWLPKEVNIDTTKFKKIFIKKYKEIKSCSKKSNPNSISNWLNTKKVIQSSELPISTPQMIHMTN